MSKRLGSSLRPPRIVATGFTTALLGDERTLREFIVGDHVVRGMRSRGEHAILYLINDSYDPLDERQLRVGVNKDPRRIEQFRPYCGRPIAEIPDPFGCHPSYSRHFASALADRLHALDVHPIFLDTYDAYHQGHYAPFVARAFEHYDEIQRQLEAEFGYPPRDLFRAQCPQCHSIDTTELVSVGPTVTFRCQRCAIERSEVVAVLRGKLSWKLDCAARWNLYGIDTEAFAKSHLAEKGTFNVSRFVSERWFGGRVPEVVKYGDLRIQRELLGHLIPMLPAAALKTLLVEPMERDLLITRESLEHFANTYEVRPGISYARFVREELPRRALEPSGAGVQNAGATAPDLHGERTLIAHANAYSEFFLGRRHEIHWPSRSVLENADPCIVAAAAEAVAAAIEVRSAPGPDGQELKSRLKERLHARPMPGVYSFVRRLIGQEHGPNISTLLCILPLDYLDTLHVILDASARARSRGSAEDGESGLRTVA